MKTKLTYLLPMIIGELVLTCEKAVYENLVSFLSKTIFHFLMKEEISAFSSENNLTCFELFFKNYKYHLSYMFKNADIVTLFNLIYLIFHKCL